MKKQINPNIRAQLLRGAFYLLLLLAVCVIPFALGQRTTGERSATAKIAQLSATSSDSGSGALAMPEFPTGGPVWDQYNNPATEPPLGIGSQQFEPPMAAFDDYAADDFIFNVPPPPLYVYITGVRVMGEYSEGGGPASSFNVYFFTNGPGNLPGTGIAALLNQPYSGTPPDFTIRWTPFSLPPGGTYWVSVQAVQDFKTHGQWFWHNRTVQSNAGAAWLNPGDGYGTGCTIWNRKNTCMSNQVWPDQVFQVLGFVEGPTPTATVTPPSSPSPTPTATPTTTPVECELFENFDFVTPPALPDGWTAINGINPDGILWQTSNSGLPSPPADSPPNAAWVNDPAAISDKYLDSPPIRIVLPTNAFLLFRSNYSLEDTRDGGVMEVSIDGGPFLDILAAGGRFYYGGYNGTISSCCGNPLAGRQAWTGSSGGFITTSVDMHFARGHTSVLRWRMGSDSSTSGEGWRIDTVQMTCYNPSPTVTATATPTATASPTPIGCGLFETFDNLTPPALPAGWIATNGIDPDGLVWQTSNSGQPTPPADSLPNAAWVNDPAAISDKYLDSPPIMIEQLKNAALMFRNNYALQTSFDGGVLEVSIDGGAFQDIIAAGGSFLQGGYNGTISNCCGNPLAGRQAWTGSSGGFITTAIDMAVFQGHSIVLRWRMGSDSSFAGQGWRIDSVQMICERPTPTSTPTLSPTATVTATPTVTPGVTPTPSDCPGGCTPSPTPTGTATATPTPTARPTPTPRLKPTPRTRPTPPPRP
jgi:hypothetical protein